VKKRWWVLQRRSSRESPFVRYDQSRHWYTLRRYSDLDRARRGLYLDSASTRNGLPYFEWRIVDEETGEEVPE
jgi:hypothetical protein